MSFDEPLDVPLPSHLTYSSCEVLEQCPMRFLFEYRSKLPPEPFEIDYGLAGRITHSTISSSFKRMRKTNLHKIIDSQSYFEEIVLTALESVTPLNIMNDDTHIALADARFSLKHFSDFLTQRFDYLAEEGRLDLFLPIDNEVIYEAEIGGVPFRGKVDAIFQDTKLRLTDWKSNKKIGLKEKEKQKRQAAIYLLLYNSVKHTQINEFYMINLWNPVNLLNSRLIIADSVQEAERRKIPKRWEIACGTHFEKRQSNENCFFCNYKNQCKDFPDIIDLSHGFASRNAR